MPAGHRMLVDRAHASVGLGQKLSDEMTSDEAPAAGHNNQIVRHSRPSVSR